ncbi:MAG: chlorophyllide a reductase subunit Z [Chloroflexota bacterium]
MAKVIRDLSDTSSYWAAIWAMCPMPDVHVICDAPIGCFNLVATAVPDYTDSVPHIENVTPSVITEQEVGGSGTGEAVFRTYEGLRDEGWLEGKKLIVVSTAESEMIGSDLSDLVSKMGEGTTYFHSESLSDDEHVGRDRVLAWLWDNYGEGNTDGIEQEAGLVNIIGPTYGCFNSPSDLHEVKRLIEGAGGRVNMVFPYACELKDITNLAKAQVNVIMYQEFGHTLAEKLGQPSLHAPFGIRGTTKFLQQLGDLLGTRDQANAFITQERKSTLQVVWDLWRGPQSDWFPTTSVGISTTRTYAEGLQSYLGDELGMPISFVAPRPRKVDEMNNHDVRKAIHDNPPTLVYGSINERIYMAEAGASRSAFMPAAFPGSMVCRSVGTPFMGYRGTVHLIQDIVNKLYDALFGFLPLDSAYSKAQGSGMAGAVKPAQVGDKGNMPWQADAQEVLDKALDKLPFLARISASRELQMRVETEAKANNLQEVTAELAMSVLAAQAD